jgi:predicted small lipoprotein YifL
MVRIALLAALIACSSKGPPAPPPPPATPDAAPAPSGPGKWDCNVDGDCMNSCSQGAVNRVWYEKAQPRECEDGCDNQVSEAPRCIDHGCVAFRSDPRDPSKIFESPDCTRRP